MFAGQLDRRESSPVSSSVDPTSNTLQIEHPYNYLMSEKTPINDILRPLAANKNEAVSRGSLPKVAIPTLR